MKDRLPKPRGGMAIARVFINDMEPSEARSVAVHYTQLIAVSSYRLNHCSFVVLEKLPWLASQMPHPHKLPPSISIKVPGGQNSNTPTMTLRNLRRVWQQWL